MTCLRPLILAALPLLLPALPAGAAPATPEADLVQRYPARSIDSVARAEAALAEVKPARQQIEELYQEEQEACYQRFLVSSCLAEVRERRRKSLQSVRRIEVEARAFLRRDKAAERDRAVTERQQKAAEGGKTIPFSGTAREGGDASQQGEP